jgi:ketosteroid isomerase-like protein
MASANLELVRSLYEAWERGDFTATDWAHPDIEFAFLDGPAPGSWKGIAGMVEGFSDWLRAWEGWHVAADEYRELDNERILVLVRVGGRGKTSGLEIGHMQKRATGAIMASLFHVRDGKVTRLINYFEYRRALADLGLSSEDPYAS